jgi:hypothetical protein
MKSFKEYLRCKNLASKSMKEGKKTNLTLKQTELLSTLKQLKI